MLDMARRTIDVAVIIPDASPGLTLHREGLLPEGLELVEKINTGRATPLVPFEKVRLTKRVRSSWLRRSFGR
jgi:hypothetical protein